MIVDSIQGKGKLKRNLLHLGFLHPRIEYYAWLVDVIEIDIYEKEKRLKIYYECTRPKKLLHFLHNYKYNNRGSNEKETRTQTGEKENG